MAGTREAVKFAHEHQFRPCMKSEERDLLFDLGEERPNVGMKFRTIEGYAFDPKRTCAVYIVRKGEDGLLVDKRAFKGNAEYGAAVSCSADVLKRLIPTPE